jgi:hypothetical protein
VACVVRARSPRAWGQYLEGVSAPSAETARFRARFRMATGFRHAEFVGLSDRTGSAYSAVLRCVLAYSTWEALRDATSIHARIDSPDLAARLRGSRGLLPYLIDATDPPVSKAVTKVADSGSDNVRHVLAALRHLHAHGAWTPTASGLTSKRAVRLLEDLTLESLDAVDRAFSEWVGSDHGRSRAEKE